MTNELYDYKLAAAIDCFV